MTNETIYREIIPNERMAFDYGMTSKADGKEARLPPGLRVYAIGYVHGRADLLDRLHDQIEADLALSSEYGAPEIT